MEFIKSSQIHRIKNIYSSILSMSDVSFSIACKLTAFKQAMTTLIIIHLIGFCCSIELTEIQTLRQPTNSILSIDITDDLNIIAAGSFDGYVYLYSNINGSYSLQQKIIGISSNLQHVDITGDGRWLLMIYYHGKGQVYKFNTKNGNFDLFQTLIMSGFYSYAGVLTDDHQWLAMTRYNSIHIYRFNGT